MGLELSQTGLGSAVVSKDDVETQNDDEDGESEGKEVEVTLSTELELEDLHASQELSTSALLHVLMVTHHLSEGLIEQEGEDTKSDTKRKAHVDKHSLHNGPSVAVEVRHQQEREHKQLYITSKAEHRVSR